MAKEEVLMASDYSKTLRMVLKKESDPHWLGARFVFGRMRWK